MHEVAIIGAGESAARWRICSRAAMSRIQSRSIDEAGQVAAGKALDIMQAAPIERSRRE